MRLAKETAEKLPQEIERFAYDRDAQGIGIVHFGIGAFHRAHQAWYTDRAMDAGEEGWAICGVSLRSASVKDQLEPQDGLYTVTSRSEAGWRSRLVGAVREVLFAGPDEAAVIERIASPDCRIVSFTVTEKGYARGGSGGLDFTAAGESFYPILTAALDMRRERGLPGMTLLSCDNLPDNGSTLQRLMGEWIAREAPALADWFADQCTVPSTMIDRIVPRSTDADKTKLEGTLGMTDEGAVFTEEFSQWVIEDDFANGRPAWEKVGAQLVDDVAPYELAKLRMLNGAHSLLAYCGLRSGLEFIHQTMADARLRGLAQQAMRDEATPTIDPAEGQDLGAYAEELLDRFANPALEHRLDQIAMDGSQKIPQRWLGTIRARREQGAQCPALLEAFDAWVWHLEDARFVDDPHGEALIRAANADGKAGVLALCLQGGEGTDPLWADYADLAPVLSK